MSSALSVRVRHLPDPLPHDEELLLKATPLAPSLQQRAGAHPPSCHTRRGVCTTPGVEASGRHWQLDVCFAGGPASGGVFPLHSPSAEGVDTGSFIALAGRLYGPPGVDGSEAPAICHLNSELEALHSREYDIPSGEFSQLVASRLSAPIRRLMGEWSLVIFDAPSHTLLFSRDALGRRSLLQRHGTLGEEVLALSSVVPGPGAEALCCISCPEAHPSEGHHSDNCPPAGTSLGLFDWQEVSCDGLHYLTLGGQDPPGCVTWLEGLFSGAEESGHQPGPANPAARLHELLSSSVRDRLQKPGALDPVTLSCPHTLDHKTGPVLGLLFSGGVDCTLLALLADQVLREVEPSTRRVPIELVNVSFERVPRGGRPAQVAPSFDTPDRLSSLEAHSELCRRHPDRDWRLVCVNAPRAEVDRCSDPTTPGTGVPAVCLPGRTVLDLSLARVLWFGARGQGILHSTGRPYWVRASTLLVGTGADELFGGYTRHRRAFERGGSTGLEAELRADLIRLPGRNFGRDDRAVGAWGRHLSAPFACERLMREVAGWPVACRAPFHEEDEGEGGKEKARPPALLRADKRPIRELCDTLMRENANSCDLTPSASANRPKRAMQFGSRVADPRENGADHAF